MLEPIQHINYSLTVNHLSFSLGDKKLIDDVSFSLPVAKKVALVGLNGAGKSSLIKLLVGEYPTQQNQITFSSKKNKRTNCHSCELAFKKIMGYQASTMLALENITAKEYLELCCLLKNIKPSDSVKRIGMTVDEWKLVSIINRPMHQLSQGNLQKLAIAQAFLSQPEFIFLDEPTQALDPLEQKRFIDNLNKLSNHQLCLFSSHHISETVASADLVLMLHKGSLVALLDLKAVDEFWFTSQLDIKQIEANLEAEQSIKLVNEKNKKLFCVKGGSELLWKKTSEKLYSSDSRFTNLGNAAQSLMPLFAELANESF